MRRPSRIALLGVGLAGAAAVAGCGGGAARPSDPAAPTVRSSDEGGDFEYSEGAVPVAPGTGAPAGGAAPAAPGGDDDDDDSDDDDADDDDDASAGPGGASAATPSGGGGGGGGKADEVEVEVEVEDDTR